MSESLNERIERTIRIAGNAERDLGIKLNEVEHIAQAIINHLCLRYETHAATEGERPMKRIIGDWAWA